MAHDAVSSTVSSPTIVQEPSPNPNDYIISVEHVHEGNGRDEGRTDGEESRTAISPGSLSAYSLVAWL